MRRSFGIACVPVACVAFFATETQAATFSDRATFLAAVSGAIEHTDLTTAFDLTAASGSSINTNYATFTDMFGADPYVILNGVENVDFDVTYTSEIFAFGMDVYEPQASTATFNGCNVGTCVESTFEISLFSGATLVTTESFSPDNEMLDFIGFTSNVGFDRIEVRESTGTNDNEFFGNFVSSPTPAAVPLPAGLPLLAIGVGLLGAIGRFRKAT